MQSLSALVLAALALAHMSGAQNILRWKTVSSCAVDNGARVIEGDKTTTYDSDNSPNSCIERCDDAGFTFAGVEFGKECHCGTGLKSPTGPVDRPVSECKMPCTGDPNLTCGGPDRIQIYKSPALPAGKYSPQGCYADPDWSPAFKDPVTVQLTASQDMESECTSFCQRAGYELAGLNDESICKCSERLSEGAVRLSKKCDWSCNEDWCVDMESLQVFHYEKA